MIDLQQTLAFTTALAKDAGALVRNMREQGQLQDQYKAQHELVTNADLAADKFIIEAIQAKFPEHQIMSEETFNDRSQT